MNDTLEKYVRKHRMEFDKGTPGKCILDKIDSRIDLKHSRISSNWLSRFKHHGFSASVLVIGVTFISQYSYRSNRENFPEKVVVLKDHHTRKKNSDLTAAPSQPVKSIAEKADSRVPAQTATDRTDRQKVQNVNEHHSEHVTAFIDNLKPIPVDPGDLSAKNSFSGSHSSGIEKTNINASSKSMDKSTARVFNAGKQESNPQNNLLAGGACGSSAASDKNVLRELNALPDSRIRHSEKTALKTFKKDRTEKRKKRRSGRTWHFLKKVFHKDGTFIMKGNKYRKTTRL